MEEEMQKELRPTPRGDLSIRLMLTPALTGTMEKRKAEKKVSEIKLDINQSQWQMRLSEWIQLILLIVMESSLSWLSLAVDLMECAHTSQRPAGGEKVSALRSSLRDGGRCGECYWFGVDAHVTQSSRVPWQRLAENVKLRVLLFLSSHMCEQSCSNDD